MRAQMSITQTDDIDAAIEVFRRATFRFPDGKVREMSLKSDGSARALSTLITNIARESSLDDAIRKTADKVGEIQGLRSATLDSLVEIYDAIEQTALNGAPDPAITVTFH